MPRTSCLILLAAVLLPACDARGPEADGGDLRRVVPLADETSVVTPRPVFESDGLAVRLGPGEAWEQPLDLQVRGQHQVVVTFEGAAPLVSAGPDGQGRFLPLRPVSEEPGRLELTLVEGRHGPGLEPTLRVRATPEGLELHGLRVRRWASVAGVGGGAGPGVRRAAIQSDSRPARELAGDWTLEARLPERATALALAWGADSGPGADPPQGRLTVTWRSRDGRERVLLDESLACSPGRWDERRLEWTGLAGEEGRLHITWDGPPILCAVPEVLCERGARRPNLVLVSLDTTRPDRMGVYGHERPTTPRLSALAAERAVVCEEVLSVSAYTLPSHATLFSGMHPLGHGVEHPAHALDTTRVPLLAGLLRERGYATRAFTGGGYLSADYGFAHGFASYGERDPARPLTAADRQFLERAPGGSQLAASLEAQSWAAALDWVESRREVPFFLFLQSFAIHDYRPTAADRLAFGAPAEGQGVVPLRTLEDQLEQPYDARERAELDALYDAAIAMLDRRLGELLDRLEALGLTDDTVFVVTADHGETLAEHGHGGVGLVGHGFGLWHEQVAVPLIVAGPGLTARRVRERLSLVDLAPTLLELLGQPVHEAMQGRSLAALFAGERPPLPPSPALLSLDTPVSRGRALYDGRWKLITGDPSARVGFPMEPTTALFDRADDAGEQRDLVSARPGDAARVQRLLDGLAEVMGRAGAGPVDAEVSDETRRTLVELGYVDR